MNSRFLGQTHFAAALELQEEAWQAVFRHGLPGSILGFESEPVITLGVRGTSADVVAPNDFEILRIDRGGQATIHHPGQLVIFPIWPVREIGARAWLCSLAKITRQCLRHWDVEARWQEAQPGLYTERGKIMACGIRIRRGVSTHGLAINVSNRLEDFARIRACGVLKPQLDKMGEGIDLKDVFSHWLEIFRRAHG